MNTALLLAVPGTSSDEAAQTFSHIDGKITERFGPIRRLWTYTSGGVRRKLAELGRPVPSPAEALRTLRAEGITHVVVKPLHMAPGMEYTDLRDTLDSCLSGPDAFAHAVMDRPLLEAHDALAGTVACLWREIPLPVSDDTALVLVTHGSGRAAARVVYDAAAAFCRHLDTPVFLGTMTPRASLESTVQACRASGARKVYLVPFMIVAGRSARTEIAGSAPASWRSALEGADLECIPVLKGLGDREAIIDAWLDQIEDGLTRVSGGPEAERGT
ncbi:MAG: sirohydrochlorin cobaltochelatase [Lentisphaerae bacterium]|nr:sirohydrochlorin cobaltochelatase [Lentisphaerota bacterium]